MQCKSPTAAGSSRRVSGPLVGLGSLNQEVIPLQKPEPGVVGMSPVDQEITQKALKTSLDLWREKKKAGSGDLVALTECAYCYHVCFLIYCSL